VGERGREGESGRERKRGGERGRKRGKESERGVREWEREEERGERGAESMEIYVHERTINILAKCFSLRPDLHN